MKNISPAVMALAAGALLASCADDLAQQAAQSDLTPVVANGYAAQYIDGDATSRTNRPVISGNWCLGFEWVQGDKVVYADPEANTLNGVITLSSMSEDKQSASFGGSLLRNGKDDFRVNTWYLGSRDIDTETLIQTVSIAEQPGTLAGLGALDVMADTRDENKLVLAGNQLRSQFALTSIMSFVRYTLTLPEGITYGGEPITVSGDNLVNSFDINLASGEINTSVGNITVTAAQALDNTADIYLVLYPGAQSLVFSVQIDGLLYKGAFDEYDYQPNTYYTKAHSEGQGCTVTTNNPALNGFYKVIYHCGENEAHYQYMVSNGFALEDNIKEHLDAVCYDHDGYTFLGWASTEDAAEAEYFPGQLVTFTEKETHFYSVFRNQGPGVNYYGPDATADGAYTLLKTVNSTAGATTQAKTADNCGDLYVHPDKIFIGWDTDRYHNKVVYAPGANITVTDSRICLYAVFKDRYADFPLGQAWAVEFNDQFAFTFGNGMDGYAQYNVLTGSTLADNHLGQCSAWYNAKKMTPEETTAAFPVVDDPWGSGEKVLKVVSDGWWGFGAISFALPRMNELSRLRVVYRVDNTVMDMPNFPKTDVPELRYGTDGQGWFNVRPQTYWEQEGWRVFDIYANFDVDNACFYYMANSSSLTCLEVPMYIKEISVVPVRLIGEEGRIVNEKYLTVVDETPTPVRIVR